MTGVALLPLVAPSRAETDPRFEAPWQAQAFAIVLHLSRAGYFDWTEWVEVFSAEIAHHPACAGEGETDAYYRQWLAALDRILIDRGLLNPEDAQERMSAWRAAYLSTPHGQPVALLNAKDPPVHAHEPDRRGVPVTISPGTPRDAATSERTAPSASPSLPRRDFNRSLEGLIR